MQVANVHEERRARCVSITFRMANPCTRNFFWKPLRKKTSLGWFYDPLWGQVIEPRLLEGKSRDKMNE